MGKGVGKREGGIMIAGLTVFCNDIVKVCAQLGAFLVLVVCGIADLHILFFHYSIVMCITNSCGPINVSSYP